MKKLLIVLVGLSLFTTASLGCRASADVDPHDSTSVVSPR